MKQQRHATFMALCICVLTSTMATGCMAAGKRTRYVAYAVDVALIAAGMYQVSQLGPEPQGTGTFSELGTMLYGIESAMAWLPLELGAIGVTGTYFLSRRHDAGPIRPYIENEMIVVERGHGHSIQPNLPSSLDNETDKLVVQAVFAARVGRCSHANLILQHAAISDQEYRAELFRREPSLQICQTQAH
jgi:hypothetical protein